MRKGNLGRLLLCCLFMLLFCAGCKNDKEKELREIENKGGSAELRTQYSKDGNVEKYTIEVYTEERIREEKYFDGEGNRKPSSILAWRIPWTEEPGGLQSMGSPRVRHD